MSIMALCTVDVAPGTCTLQIPTLNTNTNTVSCMGVSKIKIAASLPGETPCKMYSSLGITYSVEYDTLTVPI